MSLRFSLVFFTLAVLYSIGARSQDDQKLMRAEDSLKIFRDSVRNAGTDSSRILLGRQFDQKMLSVFSLPGSFGYPFDSLKSISMIRSGGDDFRICTWNIPLLNGHFVYSGFIQWNEKKYPGRKPELLSDYSDSIAIPDTVILTSGRWYGALYYKIIEEKSGNGTLYTLLGWKGTDQRITQKVIEILTFDDNGHPAFGKPVFPDYGKGKNTRILFRFSAESSMTLRYDEQNIILSKKWNPSKKNYTEKQKKILMIICDRLVPLDAALEGQYQFYVPASDLYDGFIYGKDGWKYSPGIEARNP